MSEFKNQYLSLMARSALDFFVRNKKYENQVMRKNKSVPFFSTQAIN